MYVAEADWLSGSGVKCTVQILHYRVAYRAISVYVAEAGWLMRLDIKCTVQILHYQGCNIAITKEVVR